MSFEVESTLNVIRTINDQRGCPQVMLKATEMGEIPTELMDPDARKQEYYFLLDGVLEDVIDVVHEFREEFPEGIVERDNEGNVISGLDSLQARVAPHVEKGEFLPAMYWVHDAIHKTIDIATEEWLDRTNTNSPVYQRINSLVDDERQSTYGAVAVQKRVSSAANQTVLISGSFQRLTTELFEEMTGRSILPTEMAQAHANNIQLAMPLTRLHLFETRYIRKELGAEALPGGSVELYTNRNYFTLVDLMLQFRGTKLAEKMVEYPGAFADGRIGCPGAKYIPEIWAWTGQLSERFAYPALTNLQNKIPNADVQSTLEEELIAKAERVNSGVKLFAQSLRQEARPEGDHAMAAIESFTSLLDRGGKRQRGVLTMTGYEIFGGSNYDVAISAATAVEVFHAYLLVMDDVADVSALRRGGPTAHIALGQYFKEQGINGDAAKLGVDGAQTVALFAQHRAQEFLLNLPVSAEQKILAMQILNDGLARTCMGQTLDIFAPNFKVSQEDIVKIASYKTAYYSYLLPLQLGAALAGASREELEGFKPYALYAGLAFQLQDDVIGLFEDEALTGKSRKSDIIEGKKTLLMDRALALAAPDARQELEATLGNRELTDEHFERCLEIIRYTGALHEITGLIDSYVDTAISSLGAVPQELPANKIGFLRDLAAYGGRRRK